MRMTSIGKTVGTKLRNLLLGGLVVALAGLIACDDSTGNGTGTLTITATDAPFLHGIVDAAVVQVTKIEVQASAEENSGFQTLFDAEADAASPIEMDLADLLNDVRQELVTAELPAGTVRQVRLHFSDARLEISRDTDGETQEKTYSTDDGNLMLTNQASSGLLLFIDPPIEVIDGVSSELLLDFDLTKSFLPQPAAADPFEAISVLFRPNIRVLNVSTTGELVGTVTDASAGDAAVEGATVQIFEAGADPATDDPVTTTATDAEGGWAAVLEPGTYDVIATDGTREAQADGVTVSAGSLTRVDLALP